MKVFVAGATGAIGRPLIKSLTLAGHTTFGMVRSQNSSASLSDSGFEPVIADALDAPSLSAAVAKVRPDAIINELTSLPKHYTPTGMKAAAERDARVRLEGNKNLIAAAQQTGVRRFLVQSTGFWYAPGEGLADEGERFAYGASPAVAAGAQRYAELEAMTLARTEFEAVALRYGFFYGPGTWFMSDGDMGEQVRQQQVPVIGNGQGVWSWVHIDDAADATVGALDCAPGPYNLVDDNPSEQRVWLTAFARYCGALSPPHVSEQQALQGAGPDAVYYATRLRGASNAKPNASLGFALVRFSGWLIRLGQLMDSKCFFAPLVVRDRPNYTTLTRLPHLIVVRLNSSFSDPFPPNPCFDPANSAELRCRFPRGTNANSPFQIKFLIADTVIPRRIAACGIDISTHSGSNLRFAACIDVLS